jgi:hypothetical protein
VEVVIYGAGHKFACSVSVSHVVGFDVENLIDQVRGQVWVIALP